MIFKLSRLRNALTNGRKNLEIFLVKATKAGNNLFLQK